MDGVLSVAHLKHEEVGAAVSYGKWTVVQRRQLRVVPVSANQDLIRGFKRVRIVSGGALFAAELWRVVLGVAASRVRRKVSRACSRGRSGGGVSCRSAGRASGAP